MTQKGRVAPFGDPRIKGCSPLPAAFRSVPRPSSPLSAKASTKCPYALDPKPRRRTQRAKPPAGRKPEPRSTTQHSSYTRLAIQARRPARAKPLPQKKEAQPKSKASDPNSQSHSYPQCQRSEDGGQRTEDRCPTRLTTSPKPFPSNRRTRSRGHSSSVLWSLSSDSGGADRARTGDPLLAKQVLSQLSYTPLVATFLV